VSSFRDLRNSHIILVQKPFQQLAHVIQPLDRSEKHASS
jgi:hypothetical protein